MITSIKKDKTNHFSTLDIETAPNGDVLSICIYDGKQCIHFKHWLEFDTFCEYNNDKKEYQKFIAHNGGAFDWVSLIEFLLDKFKDLTIVVQGSQIVFIEIRDYEKPIVLLDSLLVLSKSLKALCKTFEVETPKKDIDITKIEWIYHNDYEQYKMYLEHDCISLYQVLHKAMGIFEIEFWPITIASLSMYKFRKQFLKDNLFSPTTRTGEKDEFFSKSYAGGRVECFRSGVHDKVYVYDVNSLYPSVMVKADIPVCLPIKTKTFSIKSCGFYKLSFIQTNKNLPPVLWIKSKNGLEFVYEGIGVFHTAEIKLLLQVGGEIKIDYGYVFPKTKKVFKEFIEHYYAERMKYKGKPMDYCFKILMNSLYGKFAQKQKTKKLVKWDYETFRENKDSVVWSPYMEEKGIYEIEEEREIRHRAVHISSIITTLSRVALYKYFLLCPDDLIYCDTDSVHTLKPLPNKYLDEKKLGFLKKEADGEKGCYIGRKQYIIGEKKKFKGIPIKSKLAHDDIDFSDYENLFNDQTKDFNYTTFPKLKSVLKGKKACAQVKLKRKIKKSDYLTNFKRKDKK